MKNSDRLLLQELAFIAKTRNDINTRRHRARFRKNYYATALRVVEAHSGSNSELRRLDPKKDTFKIANIKVQMSYLKNKYPNPKKWQSLGLYKLRSMILQATGEYAIAKHETMEFSLKTTKRVKEILSLLCGSLKYDNGSIVRITVKLNYYGMKAIAYSEIWYDPDDIKKLAEQHELNQAVTKMVEE